MVAQATYNSKSKNRRKAIFNWAAKGLFFLRGGGSTIESWGDFVVQSSKNQKKQQSLLLEVCVSGK